MSTLSVEVSADMAQLNPFRVGDSKGVLPVVASDTLAMSGLHQPLLMSEGDGEGHGEGDGSIGGVAAR
jgi:hypothetical protein